MADPEYWTEIPRALHIQLCRSIPSPEDVEDIEQEILMAVFRARHTFRHQCSFDTWAWTIARNRFVDFYRRDSLRRRVHLCLDDGSSLNTLGMELEEDRREWMIDRQCDPISATEDAICVAQLVELAAPIYRQVLEGYGHGQSFGEIAQELGLTCEAARSRYRRAIKHIQKSLD